MKGCKKHDLSEKKSKSDKLLQKYCECHERIFQKSNADGIYQTINADGIFHTINAAGIYRLKMLAYSHHD